MSMSEPHNPRWTCRPTTSLQRKRAEGATQAALSVLGERLSEKELRGLARRATARAQTDVGERARDRRGHLAREFVRPVAEEGVLEADARVHTRAVLSTVREAVSCGELGDVLAELWRDPEYACPTARRALSARPQVSVGGRKIAPGKHVERIRDRYHDRQPEDHQIDA